MFGKAVSSCFPFSVESPFQHVISLLWMFGHGMLVPDCTSLVLLALTSPFIRLIKRLLVCLTASSCAGEMGQSVAER